MKYLHLVWAALLRRKTRTVLTILSVLVAFLLFGLLDGVRAAFNAGETLAGVDRMVVSSRFSIIQPLPESLVARVQAVPGVRKVTWANWFGGYYQEPKNQLIIFAVGPDYFEVYPDYGITKPMIDAFGRTRTGVLVGASLAKRFGWKVGDKLPVKGSIFPDKATGETTWIFDIVGIYEAPTAKSRALEQQVMLRWKYFDEANAYGSGSVGWIIVQVTNPQESANVARAIDALSVNSDHETKTQTEREFNLSFAKQIGDIGLIVTAIIGAVFFTLMLLTGNTMAQAVRERIPEFATLKTLGFTDRSVLGLVFMESVLLIVIGGVLGLALASVLTPLVSAASGGMLQLPPIGLRSWLVGLALMVAVGAIVGVLPALRAMRLRIVDALAGR
ncbi:MAG TPA: ABC transporter permease [Steroidobacteraceae bacterium]|nr:ABC transporter permease [Steroidobacteraceae bacterium]HQX79537.1 ABC transporter permease [Steroidobacteraceae bacterium]HQZ79064.1 ABC transporter permease [Steroidobacteraceae bacterium]